MKNPITPSIAKNIVRLFDNCYKQGLIDASDVGDDFYVKAWLGERREAHDYGLLSDPEAKYDWRRWRFTLLRWCRLWGMRTFGEEFIDAIRTARGFIFVVIPMSMRFYLMGIEQWAAYPNRSRLEFFKHNPKILWKDTSGMNYKAIRKADWTTYMQEFTYELSGEDLPLRNWDDFTKSMWIALRRE